MEKSRFFRKFQDIAHSFHDLSVVFPTVGAQAIGTVLDPILQIGKAAAAFVTQCIEGTVAKEAIEALFIRPGVAGKIFAFLILKKIVMAHQNSSRLAKSSGVMAG